MSHTDLISCICITRKRPALLKRAIECFRMQTYLHKELIVLFDDDDLESPEVVKLFDDKNILPMRVPSHPRIPLGELRNIAIEKSNGTFFCQWDDDDWYHRDRLQEQMRALKENHKEGCILYHWLMFDQHTKTAYLSKRYPWEGSLLCSKEVFKRFRYQSLSVGEDTPFINDLIKSNTLFPLIRPSLYIYTYHGNNTWNYDHFSYLCSIGAKLSASLSMIVTNILDQKYSQEEAAEMLMKEEFLKELNYFFDR